MRKYILPLLAVAFVACAIYAILIAAWWPAIVFTVLFIVVVAIEEENQHPNQ